MILMKLPILTVKWEKKKVKLRNMQLLPKQLKAYANQIKSLQNQSFGHFCSKVLKTKTKSGKLKEPHESYWCLVI